MIQNGFFVAFLAESHYFYHLVDNFKGLLTLLQSWQIIKLHVCLFSTLTSNLICSMRTKSISSLFSIFAPLS